MTERHLEQDHLEHLDEESLAEVQGGVRRARPPIGTLPTDPAPPPPETM